MPLATRGGGRSTLGSVPAPQARDEQSRRAFLRSAIAYGAVGGGLLSACADAVENASPVSPTSSRPVTSTIAPTTVPSVTTPADLGVVFDPSVGYWAQGGFRPVTEEIEALGLPVDGAIPSALDGVYVRNGTNGIGPSAHWFFGEGMVHGVELQGGAARSYRNRWVRTPTNAAVLRGEVPPAVPGGTNSQSNVSVVSHGGRLLSLGEVGWPFELDPGDLSTVGAVDFGGGIGANLTAHPKIDPATGLMHAFGYGLLEPPYLTYYVISADGTEVLHSTPIAVGASTMIHDFAITESDVVFWEGPVRFDLDMAVAGEPIPYRWDPDYGARVGFMPLGGDGASIRWIEVEPMFVFHGTNAHREGDLIVATVSQLPDFFTRYDGLDGPSLLTRWEIDTAAEPPTLTQTVLEETPLDLPGLDRRQVGRPLDRAWYVITDQPGDGNLVFAGLAEYDFRTGSLDRWASGPDLQPNEPLFVADPSAGPGDGWLLSYVWDRRTDGSQLAIFESGTLSSGPVATVELPQRVPFGFHATFHTH